MRRWLLLALVALGAVGCGDDAPEHPDAGSDAGVDAGIDAALPACEPPATLPTTCNGAEALCARRYDEVAYATTHNAYSSEADAFIGPNQRHTIAQQLEDGVRALMLDTYDDDSGAGEGPLLCHAICAAPFGVLTLEATLRDIAEFLRCHPAEVVTIIFESYAAPADVARAFEDSGAGAYLYVHPDGAAWPTLGALIEADTRLVVFTDDDGGAFPGYHPVWEHAYETPYAASTPEELSCTGGRGNSDAPLLIFNHFLTKTYGSAALAEMVNHDPYLSERIGACEAELADEVSFITVDFYDIGDLLAATAAQNGL